jgi:hypothetical protein
MYHYPVESNICDKHGNTLKLSKDSTVTWIGYVGMNDHMTNSRCELEREWKNCFTTF